MLNQEADKLSRLLHYKNIGRCVRGEPSPEQDGVEALPEAEILYLAIFFGLPLC